MKLRPVTKASLSHVACQFKEIPHVVSHLYSHVTRIHVACRLKKVVSRLSIKKSLFPVQRVAEIKASRAAAIFFFPLYYFFGTKILSIFRIFFFFCKNGKKSLQSHLFEPPGRSTGNKIIFMDSPTFLTGPTDAWDRLIFHCPPSPNTQTGARVINQRRWGIQPKMDVFLQPLGTGH